MPKVIVHLIAAARPNFMKVAPLYHALEATDWCEPLIVHTGQHYDANMSDDFFRDLGLPAPAFHLGVGSGSHAEQTGGVMIAYEKVCLEARPDWIVVVGDVNSTAACAMVGTKLWIPVVHLEAGLRSRDRRMPEEINRLVTDSISDVLWTPSADANENLLAEGVPDSKIELIGNIMIDSFELLRDRIEASDSRERLGVNGARYAVLTLHRPSNVDHEDTLGVIVDALESIAGDLRLVFVSHPRTMKNLKKFGLEPRLRSIRNLDLLEPLPYIDFMNVATGATLVITDSGGLQEETTYLGIPCLTLRENTERPITVTQGTNELVGAADLPGHVSRILSGDWKKGSVPPLWDGRTAERAVESLKKRL
ncbi:MAG TPA: UDP-N-acetylglucosamine 2-epimerase (non-hydrolyzing) [Woeseiaceae bacterium]|nr:UDP-N-acetylglucosamine 2-epimerase (non-hydrolyzing) [Woeseiaceae bacterium]